jgi:hypothetical protein
MGMAQAPRVMTLAILDFLSHLFSVFIDSSSQEFF